MDKFKRNPGSGNLLSIGDLFFVVFVGGYSAWAWHRELEFIAIGLMMFIITSIMAVIANYLNSL